MMLETWKTPIFKFQSSGDLKDCASEEKDDIMKILEEKNWKERTIPDPTLLPRLIRKRKE